MAEPSQKNGKLGIPNRKTQQNQLSNGIFVLLLRHRHHHHDQRIALYN